MKKYACAISHLPHLCSGADKPIENIRKSLFSVKKANGVLVCSHGGLNWDLQLAVALDIGLSMELVLLDSDNLDDLCSSFGKELLELSVDIIWVNTSSERDLSVFNRADIIIPVWVRTGGRIASILSELTTALVDWYDVSDYRFKSRSKYSVAAPSEEIYKLPSDYLWHWTRGTFEKWSNETQREYCMDIVESNTYPRSALKSLKRIISMNRIVASGKCIYQNEPVVSFTEKHPSEMSELFTWRNGRHRMNFEPYAIGFPRAALSDQTIVKVKYNSAPAWYSITKGQRWIPEQEWRTRGDVVFSSAMLEHMIIIVLNKDECFDAGSKRLCYYNETPK